MPSRKDYVAVAAAIAKAYEKSDRDSSISSIAYELADHFVEDNPNFNRGEVPRSLSGFGRMSTVTVTVQDYVLGMMSHAEEQALGLALYDAHFVEHVDITWWRPVDKMERHIKFTGDQAIIQPVVTMLVELSKTYESPVSVVRSLAAC